CLSKGDENIFSKPCIFSSVLTLGGRCFEWCICKQIKNIWLEKKKMVVNALINRIEVSRDYKVKIDFNFDFEQFTNGLDIAA
ncbi:MAG: hypothetical protein IKM48_02765, partial [Clostridia bacterium]|nr:hypothetical protein [Clostridia bacterium]